MSKHTPGPWVVKIGTEEDAWANQWPTIQADDYEVVGTEGLYGDMDTDMANARLIAAAPDLLNALTLLAEVAERRGIPCDAARAAIAKAKGE